MANEIEFIMKEISEMLNREEAVAAESGTPVIVKVKFTGFNSGAQTKWLNISRGDLLAIALELNDRNS